MLLALTKGVDSRIRFLAFKCNIVIKTQAIWSLLIHQTMLKKRQPFLNWIQAFGLNFIQEYKNLLPHLQTFVLVKLLGFLNAHTINFIISSLLAFFDNPYSDFRFKYSLKLLIIFILTNNSEFDYNFQSLTSTNI